ncbi:DNA/RNA non-specific endonuclease [Puia sp.]|jgi:DNA/RNA endonuclease G (NUC1)|uniref:DNA/RNA non-specific endonuclease n=1 Tax=Puia sp. TaxID=2045100 RepID=UPI002F42EC99
MRIVPSSALLGATLSLISLLPLKTKAQHAITIKHTYYTNLFDTLQCSEIQGFYVQTKERAAISLDKTKKIKRPSSFTIDPATPSACQFSYPSNYTTYNKKFEATDLNNRLDKGHINPYQAFNFDDTASKESMYYTNVCPQISWFNEHQWQGVEMYIIKTVAPEFGDVKVWTGVLVSTAHPRKAGKLFIPDYYWKIIGYQKNGQPIQEAWLGKNRPANTSTDPDAIRIDTANLKRIIRQYYPNFSFDF